MTLTMGARLGNLFRQLTPLVLVGIALVALFGRSLPGFGLYLFWLIGGPAVHGCTAIALLHRTTWTLSPVEAVYWLVFALTHVARTLQAPPAGDPSFPPLSITSWRVRFSVAAVVLWCVGQSLEVLA